MSEHTTVIEGMTVDQQHQLTKIVDEAIARFRGRDLVATSEVTDVLLDLRLLLLEFENLEELFDEEPSPTPAG